MDERVAQEIQLGLRALLFCTFLSFIAWINPVFQFGTQRATVVRSRNLRHVLRQPSPHHLDLSEPDRDVRVDSLALCLDSFRLASLHVCRQC